MGIALWLLCGVAVFAASRAIRPGRPPRLGGELLAAVLVACGAGLAATALDFGGWNEPDWRAALFAVSCAFAAIGAARAVRMMMTRRATSR